MMNDIGPYMIFAACLEMEWKRDGVKSACVFNYESIGRGVFQKNDRISSKLVFRMGFFKYKVKRVDKCKVLGFFNGADVRGDFFAYDYHQRRDAIAHVKKYYLSGF